MKGPLRRRREVRSSRTAPARAVRQFFDWFDAQGSANASLSSIEPLHVALYIEELSRSGHPASLARHRRQVVGRPYSAPAVKQHLAAIRMLLDWLVTGGVLPTNPAAAVKGPRYSVAKGLTPVLSEEAAKQLFAAIATDSIGGVIERGGTVEKAQQIAAHSDVRTTKLYDRSNDERSLDEIERISI